MNDFLNILNFNDDISYQIDDKLNISFKIKNKKNSKIIKYPILLKPTIEIEVSEEDNEIKEFLSGNRLTLEQPYVLKFLNLANINIIVFLISFMKKQNIDMLFFDNMLLVDSPEDENGCLFFNNKLIPYEPIIKIKKTSFLENRMSTFKESMEEISYFIKKKINSSISNNVTLSYGASEFKDMQKQITYELNSNNPNLIKILNIYEKMIEYRSAFFSKEENLMSDEELIEIIEEFNTLKELLLSKFDIEIKALPENSETH